MLGGRLLLLLGGRRADGHLDPGGGRRANRGWAATGGRMGARRPAGRWGSGWRRPAAGRWVADGGNLECSMLSYGGCARCGQGQGNWGLGN